MAGSSYFAGAHDDSRQERLGPNRAPSHRMLNDAVDQLAERVIGCAIEVHRTMGPGLLESIYHECLAMELEAQQIPFEVKRRISVDYKGRPLKAKFETQMMSPDLLISCSPPPNLLLS
jgi:hypothetical protein